MREERGEEEEGCRKAKMKDKKKSSSAKGSKGVDPHSQGHGKKRPLQQSASQQKKRRLEEEHRNLRQTIHRSATDAGKVRKQCLRKYVPDRELTIDEAMIRYKGFKASVRKFFMPLKPIRAGFKVYAIAESATGFILNFIVHPHGQKPAKMLDITMDTAQFHLNAYHHLYTDKLYTSIPLARHLLSKKMYLTGAIKGNSKGLPKDFNSERVKRTSSNPRGSFSTRQNGQLTVAAWKDSRVMLLLSSAHQGWRDPQEHSVQRKIADDGTGRLEKKTISAPPQAIDYTRYMGGVDPSNSLESSDEDESAPTHSKFILDVATELIDGYAQGRAKVQLYGSKRVKAKNALGHTSTRMPGRYAHWCRWCRLHNGVTKSRRTKTARRGCQACGVYLCAGPCFIKYHSLESSKDAGNTTSTTYNNE
ncbi:uncharacterized protein LOC117301036 [Asterias rubens]|uniref:uncharacterized protein LOC117301036 n=1 Tax=Asterias rubens TaxID=7604 RepID=UPI0014557593|nr:uncharacterized protein LOC117301036 [Asterias rubens]